jgi:hypothetical protein
MGALLFSAFNPLDGCSKQSRRHLQMRHKPLPRRNPIGLRRELGNGPSRRSTTRAKAAISTRLARVLSQLVLIAPDDDACSPNTARRLLGSGAATMRSAFLGARRAIGARDWSLYFGTRVAYDQKGNYPAAQSYYDRALALKPGDAGVLNNAACRTCRQATSDGAEKAAASGCGPARPIIPRIAQNPRAAGEAEGGKAGKDGSRHSAGDGC